MPDIIPDAPPLILEPAEDIPDAPPLVIPPPLAPPRQGGPAMGKSITSEQAPKVEEIRVGIELEGVGSIRTQWSRDTVIKQKNFHHVFKRMKLVRSPSFDKTKGIKGVYITPEDAEGTFGTQSPAELVSAPHALAPASLASLFRSVWKVFTPTGMKPGTADFHDPRKGANQQAATATSRFGKHVVNAVGGSLQTTIGVSVEKLLSDTPAVRQAASKYLVGDRTLEGYVNALADAAVAAQGYLTASRDRPLFGIADAQRFGVRLALFLAFVETAVIDVPEQEGGQWSKSRLGCIFKGQSSFMACGLNQGNRFLEIGLKATGRDIKNKQDVAAFKADLVAGIRAVTGDTWATGVIAGKWFNPAVIGTPGRSLQTSVEGWYAFPNFVHQKKLYTVVECRKKTAGLNVAMAAFLNTKGANMKAPMIAMLKPENKRYVDAAATTFCTTVKAILAS